MVPTQKLVSYKFYFYYSLAFLIWIISFSIYKRYNNNLILVTKTINKQKSETLVNIFNNNVTKYVHCTMQIIYFCLF